MVDDNSTWQSLMDEAYSRWQDDGDLKGLDLVQFISALPTLSAQAVVLGNLNYQVENGGFSQWVNNGYCLTAKFLIKTLEEIGTQSSLAVICMINELIPYIDLEEKDSGCMGDYFVSETETCTALEPCQNCNGEGYEDESEESIECSECGGSGEIEEEHEETTYPGEEIANGLDSPFYELKDIFQSDVENYLTEKKGN